MRKYFQWIIIFLSISTILSASGTSEFNGKKVHKEKNIFKKFNKMKFLVGRKCTQKSKSHSTRCDQYFECVDSADSDAVQWISRTCDEGLIYEENLGICVLPGAIFEFSKKTFKKSKIETLCDWHDSYLIYRSEN